MEPGSVILDVATDKLRVATDTAVGSVSPPAKTATRRERDSSRSPVPHSVARSHSILDRGTSQSAPTIADGLAAGPASVDISSPTASIGVLPSAAHRTGARSVPRPRARSARVKGAAAEQVLGQSPIKVPCSEDGVEQLRAWAVQMFIQQNESLMKLGHAADLDRDRVDRLWLLGRQIQENKANMEAMRQETAASVLTLRDELNVYSEKVKASGLTLIELNQQFESHVKDAFGSVRDECATLRAAIAAVGPSDGFTSSNQLQANLELAALRAATESLHCRLAWMSPRPLPLRHRTCHQ